MLITVNHIFQLLIIQHLLQVHQICLLLPLIYKWRRFLQQEILGISISFYSKKNMLLACE